MGLKNLKWDKTCSALSLGLGVLHLSTGVRSYIHKHYNLLKHRISNRRTVLIRDLIF